MKYIPEFLIELLQTEYGDETAKRILDGYEKTKVTTFRVNTLKATCEEVEKVLKELNIPFAKVNWYNDAFIVNNDVETKVRESVLYKEGKIYFQSLSSMLPPLILEPNEKESILDMAAAPGGKTTQIAALTSNNSLITAVEKNPVRAERLKYNLSLQGANRVSVLVSDAKKLDEFFRFDKILLDAPCSGSGTLNAFDPKTNKVFTKTLVNNSKSLQIELLKKASQILKVNGEMIYSTCSILKEENEQVLEEVLKQGNLRIVPIDNDLYKDIPMLPVTIPGTMCVCPTEFYEGFFVAKLKKIK